ncbi:diamine acetyltransferase 2-like isoform X3 [Trachemys scripta elegans]|uniref:diamine acetyltransferase 2-like isoform X3 n=1 Tax=Trachemys scripta elegans TaxID=31138 RepID=UPI001555F1E8|nr:diamine acetyltransferase 2-like isoform X3 [Trachemys scripta elegans]
MECVLRPCRAEDCAEVMRMIKELAEFEELPDQVQISDQVLREDGFANDPFYRCLVAEVPPEHRSQDGHTVVGYGLYFFTYSTWKGRNIYMEDLYVMPEFRGKGIGKKLMSKIAEMGAQKWWHSKQTIFPDLFSSQKRPFFCTKIVVKTHLR